MGRRWLTAFVAFALAFLSLPLGAMPAAATSPDLVISQIYGGGGNSGAQFKNDFVELFNRGASAVSLNGKSVQYATTTGALGANGLMTLLPNVMLGVGQYFLVQEAAGAGRDRCDQHVRDGREGRARQLDGGPRLQQLRDLCGSGLLDHRFDRLRRRDLLRRHGSADAVEHDRRSSGQRRLRRHRQQRCRLRGERASATQQRVAHAFLRR